MAPSLVGLTVVACAFNQYEPAVRLLGAVAALVSATNRTLDPMERSDYERSTAVARAQLDAVTFDQAWAAGQAMVLEQAIAEAVALAATAEAASSVSSRSAYPGGLSRR